MVQIKFIKSGANSLFGGFSSGDTLRCPESLAAHLVNEAQVAKYVEVPAAPVESKPAEAPKRGRKAKE